MNFMANILPVDIDRWNITDGSITTKAITLSAGATASCLLGHTDLEYIPSAFLLRAEHNVNTNWKRTVPYFKLQIKYTDGTVSNTLWPFDKTRADGNMFITNNIALVESKTYTEMTFSIVNNMESKIIITLKELYPSMDMDENLYNNIEGMLPQMVYAYNDSNVTVAAAVETQIVQLPVTVKQDTNLLLHATVTGQTGDDTLSCIVRLDGDTIKSFPLRQTVATGEFYFGVPSLIAFVKTGVHIVTLHLLTTSGEVIIPSENALLVVDGKGILGGASGKYPHAEVSVGIPISGMYNYTTQEIILTELDPDMYTFSTNIPLSMNNLATDIVFEVVRRGEIIDFDSLSGLAPPLTPYDSSMYYTDMYGMKSIDTATYNYTKEVKEDCTITTTVVDTTKFSPIYTRALIEEVND